MVQVYTGEGKGKTTAAAGLALRALGHGLPVLWVSFLKPIEPPPGEWKILRSFDRCEFHCSGVGVFGRAAQEVIAGSVRTAFEEAKRRLAAGDFALAILDEINNAVHRGYLTVEELVNFLDGCPPSTELVLTGRHAHPEVLARADLVTCMEMIKHPYAKGIAARAGIEF